MREVVLAPDAIPAAHEIFRRMRERGIGQKALAVAAGLNDTYVRDLLKGKSKNPKNDQLDKIAKELGCTLDDLVNPRGAENVKEDERTAKTPEELALLRIWRRASDIGRDRIMSAVERAMIGDLIAPGEAKDI